MDNLVKALALVLGKEETVVSEALASDEASTALVDEISSLKVMTAGEFNEIIGNVKVDYKDKMYKEIHGSAMEKNEKELMKAFDVDLKYGTDFNNNIELVRKIVDIKSESAEPSDEVNRIKAELSTVKDAYTELKATSDQKVTDAFAKANERIATTQLNSLIDSHRANLDMEDDEAKDAQIEFLKYQFQKNYNVQMDDDNIIVTDKDGNPVNNEDFSKKTLSDVVSESANKYLKFKEVVPVKGRGNDKFDNPTPNTKVNWSKFGNDFDTYYEQELKGKGVQIGSKESNEAYADFQANVNG